MQITNSATIVDFFPEAFIAEACELNGMKSYSVVTEIDARNEWESRIAKGAEVTDFNLDKMPQSEYMPMSC